MLIRRLGRTAPISCPVRLISVACSPIERPTLRARTSASQNDAFTTRLSGQSDWRSEPDTPRPTSQTASSLQPSHTRLGYAGVPRPPPPPWRWACSAPGGNRGQSSVVHRARLGSSAPSTHYPALLSA